MFFSACVGVQGWCECSGECSSASVGIREWSEWAFDHWGNMFSSCATGLWGVMPEIVPSPFPSFETASKQGMARHVGKHLGALATTQGRDGARTRPGPAWRI